jgi:dipeptidyl-peptidase-3
MTKKTDDFKYFLEQFADIKIMQYKVNDFEKLSVKQKTLIYYLSQASLCGRDIIYDQFYKHNLTIRRTNESIINSFTGDKTTNTYKEFEVYAKRVWFSNGIHHHYSSDKFFPQIEKTQFIDLIKQSDFSQMPTFENEDIDAFAKRVTNVIYDDKNGIKKVEFDSSKDIVNSSAVNFYENVSEEEVIEYNKTIKIPNEQQPISIGLNSKLIKKNNTITELTYSSNGMYGKAISKIIYWLEKALTVTENSKQNKSIQLLIDYYKTGNLETWDRYNIAWLQDIDSQVDFVNGFIENYNDPLGMKATWESIVNFKNTEATKRTKIISSNAQWFEDNAPIDPRFKKKEVKGVTAKVITVVQLGGDCYPSTPIGINLPNADWIRRDYGSKSVTIENITEAYDKASKKSGFLEEFCYSKDEIDLAKQHGHIASNLHTDLHECLGHGSGQLLPDTSPDALKNYSSVLEEARADLFALYFLGDQKLIDLKLISSFDITKTEYNSYIRNGLLTQLIRIKPGKDIEQAHMRNRQLISSWCYQNGKKDNVIELVKKDNKTYCVINDYTKLRELFKELLAEIQRIKSEGDYNAGKHLVETYGIKIDNELHNEILTRYKKLNIAPYGGFINPILNPILDKDNNIKDITIDYSADYLKQMLFYSKKYSFLPNYN